MTESKHTPGPWALDGTGWICDVTGSPVCLINAGIADHELEPQERADSRLIAASPKLLKALEDLVEAVERDAMIEGVSGIACDKLPDARAAIKEAKGE